MLDGDFEIYKKIIEYISNIEKEPSWISEFRLKSLILYKQKKYKNIIKNINDFKIKNYINKLDFFIKNCKTFPYNITKTNNGKIYISEKKIECYLSDFFKNLKNDLKKEGIICINSIEELKKYPTIFKQFFNTNILMNKNPFYLLNSVLFRFGLFVYIPKGVKIVKPIQNIFIKNKKHFNQFNKILIVLDEGSELTYIEGCTSKNQIMNNLINLPVIEIILMKNSSMKYIELNNDNNNIINLINKNVILKDNSNLIYLNFNINSKININYTNFILEGNNSKLKTILIGVYKKNSFKYKQLYIQHIGNKTFSNIVSKSILINNGINYINKILDICNKNYKNITKSHLLLLNNNNFKNSNIFIKGSKRFVKNEISILKIYEKEVYFLMKKGFSRKESINSIINQFLNNIINEFPIEFSIEFISLIYKEIENL